MYLTHKNVRKIPSSKCSQQEPVEAARMGPKSGLLREMYPPNALQQSNCALSGSQLLQGEGCVSTSLNEVVENWV